MRFGVGVGTTLGELGATRQSSRPPVRESTESPASSTEISFEMTMVDSQHGYR